MLVLPRRRMIMLLCLVVVLVIAKIGPSEGFLPRPKQRGANNFMLNKKLPSSSYTMGVPRGGCVSVKAATMMVAGNVVSSLTLVHAIDAGLLKRIDNKKNGNKDDDLESALAEIYRHKVFTLATIFAVGNIYFPWLLRTKSSSSWMSAVGWGYAVGALGVVSMLTQGFPAKFGFTIPGLTMELVIHVLAAIVLLVPQLGLSPRIVQVIASFGLLNGIVGYMRPVKFATVWGLTNEESRRPSIQKGTRSVAAAIAASRITTLVLLVPKSSPIPSDLAVVLGGAVLALGRMVNNFLL